MVLRGAFRLLLGLLVTLFAAVGFLEVLEFVLTKPGPGEGEATRERIYSGQFYALALVFGGVLAILCDRIWMQLRGLGPELRLPSSRT